MGSHDVVSVLKRRYFNIRPLCHPCDIFFLFLKIGLVLHKNRFVFFFFVLWIPKDIQDKDLVYLHFFSSGNGSDRVVYLNNQNRIVSLGVWEPMQTLGPS